MEKLKISNISESGDSKGIKQYNNKNIRTMGRTARIETCSVCKTKYRVSETGQRFPWNDREEYHCPVCGECGGSIKTHYILEEEIIEKGIEPDTHPQG